MNEQKRVKAITGLEQQLFMHLDAARDAMKRAVAALDDPALLARELRTVKIALTGALADLRETYCPICGISLATPEHRLLGGGGCTTRPAK